MRSFTERQRFDQPWLWVVLIGVDILVVYQLYNDYQANINQNSSYLSYALGIGIITLMTVLIFSIRLETRYDKLGVTYRFFPIMLNHKIIPLNQITSYVVKDIHPLTSFGGWGYKWSVGKLLLNTHGNYGIVINRKEGQQITLGTQQPEEIKEVMRYLFKEDKEEHYG
ncbi:hypothetical protein [Fulvivirga lutimaris]|uniref:hypothetical protein n=1 Tax=Fulvivirga lutimaris TaxID=1819566 RepID=UPI0012BD646D|nr:hypothetical protein [Fulvivirga lutimaris]MTI39794.1 hypothetical protein [Fulvivirga lutimaris]